MEHIKEQTDLIAMQENLGLGHKGNILITTQERVDKNLPPIATEILDSDFANLICSRCNSHDGLVEAAQTTINRLKGTVARAAFKSIGQLGALNILFDELEQALTAATTPPK